MDRSTRTGASPEQAAARAEEGRRLPSTNFDLEKLGRQRPEAFASALSEILFCFSLLGSMFMAVYTFSDPYFNSR